MLSTLLYIIGAWFVYTILGFLANAIQNGEAFDPTKFGRSLIWAIIVVVLALALGIEPVIVIEEYGDILGMIVTVIANSGFGIALIYGLDRLYRIITGFFGRFQVKTS